MKGCVDMATKRSYVKYNIECRVCKNEFQVPAFKKDSAKYCSKDCRIIGVRKPIETECTYCQKKVTVVPSVIKKSASGNVFCSNECVGHYNSYKSKEKRIQKVCLICNKNYDCKPSEADTSVTCSHKCQHQWQSQYLRGKKANNYKHNITDIMRIHNCDWCNKEFDLIHPYKIKLKEQGKSLFCSKDCYREWYAKSWSQQDEWKNESRIRTIQMIAEGKFPQTETAPHLKVNKILDELDINYVNEYDCKYVIVDIFLPDHNLMIEVNGSYWHCDPRTYEKINYKTQLDRIIADKRKNTYIKSQYGIDILYLWESDIQTTPDLCKELIKSYVEGNLISFHSFNYELNNSKVTISNNITPYSSYEINKLNALFSPINNINKDKRDKDKWIKFNCDYCNKETEQLISKYNKNKTHCCSISCSAKLRNK